MRTALFSRLRQSYRYHRNWQKYKHRRAKGKNRELFNRQAQFYSQFIKKNDLCFDVGANVGDKTEIFLQVGAVVVAVEPQESCWRVLKRRFRNKNVHVINRALDKSAGNKEIFVDRSPTISSMSAEWIDSVKKSGRFSKHSWNYKIMIETTTLDALIEQFGNPVFCKIDVEGFEFEVLQGLSQPVAALSFEFTPEYLEAAIGCIQHLAKLGKAEFNYSLADSMSLSLPNWVGSAEIKTALTAMDRDTKSFGDVYVRFVSG